MVWSPGAVAVEFRGVPQLFFNVTLYTLIHFSKNTQKSNAFKIVGFT